MQSCRAFSFVAASGDESHDARTLLYSHAIEWNSGYADEGWAPSAEIRWPDSSRTRFRLIGLADPHSPQTRYSLIYLVGGAEDPRAPVCTGYERQFERLRSAFAKRWQLKSGATRPNNSSKPTPLRGAA